MRQSMKQIPAALILGVLLMVHPVVLDAAHAQETPQNVLELANSLRRGDLNKPSKSLSPPDRVREYQAPFNKAHEKEAQVSSGLTGMFRVLATALIMLGLGYGLLLLIKKIRRKKVVNEETGSLKLVESLWLGKGLRVMLVNVGEQQVLLGASGGAIQSLAVFTGPAGGATLPPESAANDDFFPTMLRSEMKETSRPEPTYGRNGRLETREEEVQSNPKVSNERVKQILKRLNHL